MDFKPSDIRVALVAGGTSGERDISLASGTGAREALEQAGFSVVSVDPANKEDLVSLTQQPFDVAFLCLHGRGGEDGTIQGFLETIGLPYTGPGIWSSATAIDKARSKHVYMQAGIPTPEYLCVSSKTTEAEIDAFLQKSGLPVVVKPASEGSALGVEIVSSRQDVQPALQRALGLDSTVLIEQYIRGREITVAVLGNDEYTPLPVIEIIPRNSFYDFDAKYAPGGSQHICPAPLSDQLTQQAQKLACEAHRALECRGMSRTDMIVDTQESMWVLETNTIPGMTPTSLLPDAAAAAGIDFPTLCTQLIAYALEAQ